MTDKSIFDQPQAATLVHDEPPENLHIVNDRSFFGQPRGLATLFFALPTFMAVLFGAVSAWLALAVAIHVRRRRLEDD